MLVQHIKDHNSSVPNSSFTNRDSIIDLVLFLGSVATIQSVKLYSNFVYILLKSILIYYIFCDWNWFDNGKGY
jgi:ammonia channel protein AmtB